MQRLVFANQLRGLAALSVVGSHWVGVHFADPKAFAQATATPVETGPVSDLFGVFSQPWFNFGPFGVALFFLISGLVIPISLGSHTRKSFLVARLLRIYPTYVAGLAIGAAAVFASARYWGLPMPFGWSLLAMNAALVMDLVGRVSIDLVNWTLATELKFYVLMLLAAPLIRRGSLAALFCLAALTLGYNLIWSAHGFGHLQDRYAGPFGMASLEALSVGFMLIGVVFSYHVRGQIGGAAAILAVALLCAMFGYGWQHSVAGPGLWPVGVNYLQGLMVFTTAYLVRDWFRPFAPLDFFARISFPLYAIHALLGFCILKYLTLALGLAYLPALAISFAAVVAVAAGLSATVEAWSIEAGRRLVPRRQPESSPVRPREMQAVS